jgi:ADP-ribose pyrophosphatase YjhB (NUDIX family)
LEFAFSFITQYAIMEKLTNKEELMGINDKNAFLQFGSILWDLIKKALFSLLLASIVTIFSLVLLKEKFSLKDQVIPILAPFILIVLCIFIYLLISLPHLIQNFSYDAILALIEGNSRLHNILINFVDYIPLSWQSTILHYLNPKITMGALAIIKKQIYSESEPEILLGYHRYRERSKVPWALIGGVPKERDQNYISEGYKSLLEATVIREVKEETGIDIEVKKLLSIDTDWNRRMMDYYFECEIKKEEPTIGPISISPEISKIQWYKISKLPSNMFPPHKNYLLNVFEKLSYVPGIYWTTNQTPPSEWNKFQKIASIKKNLRHSRRTIKKEIIGLINDTQQLLECDNVSLFISKPAIKIISNIDSIATDTNANLRLFVEASSTDGVKANTEKIVLKINSDKSGKWGLTSWVFKTPEYGKPKILNEAWLKKHKHVVSINHHNHLIGGTCYSLIGVSLVFNNKLLGLLKAENKTSENGSKKYCPFTPDDSYILEEIGMMISNIIYNNNDIFTKVSKEVKK